MKTSMMKHNWLRLLCVLVCLSFTAGMSTGAFAAPPDRDGDGYDKRSDCDDNNAAVNPGASEGPFGDATCSDTWDNDCNGLTDGDDPQCQGGSTCTDNDLDGYGNPGDASCPNGGATDCDDNNAAVNPGATEGPLGDATCSDTWDNDCNGLTDVDDLSCQPGDEVCNDGFDNDGDGDIDCADSDCAGESACTAGNKLTANYVTGSVLGIGPDSGLWNATTATTYSMSWRDDINDSCPPDNNCSGNSPTLTVKAIHNGNDIAFLMSWNDVTQSSEVYQPSEFGDRAVIMLNANRICQMGSPNNPTNMWFWNAADKTQGAGGSVQNLLGGGIGTITHTDGDDNIQVVSSHSGGLWQVVMSRPLAAIDAADQFEFTTGVTTEVSFAVYDGAFKQRNGAKWITGRESMDIAP
ncbi:MAG: ethylbenzene dehydrogenase-related protein [Pseudomonadota bacterium]